MKRVFLSFLAEDADHVWGVRLLASSPKYSDLEFFDESVRVAYDSVDAAYIKSRIREKIRRSSVTVCLISELTHKSRWVTWELQESIDQGNLMLAMAVKGVTSATVPAVLKAAGVKFWSWDADHLGRLIAGS